MICNSCGSKNVEYKTRSLCRSCYNKLQHKGLIKKIPCKIAECDKFSSNRTTGLCQKHHSTFRYQTNTKFRLRVKEKSKEFKYLFRSLKFQAKTRGIDFNLTLEQFSEIRTGTSCFYCGYSLPEQGGGLDRINSNKGYQIGNVIPCCTGCNMFKGNMISYDEMNQIIPLLQKIRNKKFIWDEYITNFIKKSQENRKEHPIIKEDKIL